MQPTVNFTLKSPNSRLLLPINFHLPGKNPVAQIPNPMLRFSISLVASLLLFNTLFAQTEPAPNKRFTEQDLSPAEAKIYHETNAVEQFAQTLALLKTAFSEKDVSRIVAYEANILRAMRIAADHAADTRQEQMNGMLADFEAHSFNIADPVGAARDFAKLEEFHALMQAGLKQ